MNGEVQVIHLPTFWNSCILMESISSPQFSTFRQKKKKTWKKL